MDPPNLDPSEGTADVDGDGTPNFIDPDNDGDGLLDANELAMGSSINLETPQIFGVTPSPVPSFTPTTVQVDGAFLGSVSSVSYGPETPTPTALTTPWAFKSISALAAPSIASANRAG